MYQVDHIGLANGGETRTIFKKKDRRGENEHTGQLRPQSGGSVLGKNK